MIDDLIKNSVFLEGLDPRFTKIKDDVYDEALHTKHKIVDLVEVMVNVRFCLVDKDMRLIKEVFMIEGHTTSTKRSGKGGQILIKQFRIVLRQPKSLIFLNNRSFLLL